MCNALRDPHSRLLRVFFVLVPACPLRAPKGMLARAIRKELRILSRANKSDLPSTKSLTFVFYSVSRAGRKRTLLGLRRAPSEVAPHRRGREAAKEREREGWCETAGDTLVEGVASREGNMSRS